MTDSHHLLEAWLIEGAIGDPPRELAVHAAVCDSCARRLGAFDSLATVDVSAAGSPLPAAAPSRLVLALGWARRGGAVFGTVVAGVIVVFAASQLAGLVGDLPAPTGGVAFETGSGEATPDAPGSEGPEPAGEPSVAAPTPSPIPTFIPLPSLDPQATALSAPAAPNLSRGTVTQSSINMFWSNGSGGGPVQKWEIWRRIGAGTWHKLGELPASTHSLTNAGLAPGTTYAYRIRGVNVSSLGSFSNTITGTTLSPPAPTPPPPTPPPPTPVPTPTPSIPPEPTPTPTPEPTPTPVPTPPPSIPPSP